MPTVEIITSDGRVYTDPREVKIERNEKTEMFFVMLENFNPDDETA